MSTTFSYSRLDTYQQCGFKYYLQYVLGHYVYSDSIATCIGTLIHETEESIANSIVAEEAIDYTKLKNNIIAKIYMLQAQFPRDYNELDKSNRTYYEKIYGYLESGIYKLEQFMQEHPTYKIVGIEKEFNVKYKDEAFRGFIDRVFYDTATDRYIIQDIKTYALAVEKDKLATPLQFVIYTLAAKEIYNCTADQISCEYYLPFCDLTQSAGTTGYMNRGITKIDKLFNSIDNQEFEPHQSPLCNWCNFCATNPNAPEESKYLCPYFSKWERTTRNKGDIKKVNHEWQGLDTYPAILESYQATVKEVK